MGYSFDEPDIVEVNPADLEEAEAMASEPSVTLRQVGSSNNLTEIEDGGSGSRHLWLGNLNSRLPRTVLKALFEQYGPVSGAALVALQHAICMYIAFGGCRQ